MKYIGLFSGGKDSLVACHIMQNQLDGVLYAQTGIGLKENIDYVHNICQKFGWNLYTVKPKNGENYEDFVRKFGFPKKGIHSSIMGYLKYHPWRTFARKNKGVIFISGRRKKESKRRSTKLKLAVEKVDGMTFMSPLFHWSDKDVWEYIKEHNLPLSPVYETLHMSGDCLCGAFSQLGESYLIATFHKTMSERIQALESKYGGTWGNQSSVTGAVNTNKITSYMCGDCIITE